LSVGFLSPDFTPPEGSTKSNDTMEKILRLLLNNNSLEFTGFVACAAFGAFILINDVGLFLITGDGLDRAPEGTEPATVAFLGQDLVMKKRLTNTGSAFFIKDMLFIFRSKMP
jgi:hypothetical protein